MKALNILFLFIVSQQQKEVNTEKGRSGIQETRGLPENRGEGNSQSSDKDFKIKFYFLCFSSLICETGG